MEWNIGRNNKSMSNKLYNMINEQQKDDELWQTARARVAFRWSFACYFVVNAFW
jgi:hypothetical protein